MTVSQVPGTENATFIQSEFIIIDQQLRMHSIKTTSNHVSAYICRSEELWS